MQHASEPETRGFAARLSFVAALFLFAAALVAVFSLIAPR